MFDQIKTPLIDNFSRYYEIAYNVKISPEWESLFLDYTDRIMIGIDNRVIAQRDNYEEILAFDRNW